MCFSMLVNTSQYVYFMHKRLLKQLFKMYFK